MSMTEIKTEELERITYIRYLMIFKDQTEILLDLERNVNLINQAFAQQLNLKIWKTNVEA